MPSHFDPMTITCVTIIVLLAAATWVSARRHTSWPWILPAGLAVITLAAWAGAHWRATVMDAQMRHKVVREATGVARAIDPTLAKRLLFTPADQSNPAYRRICGQMQNYSRYAGLRSLYSMAVRDGGIVFGPEGLARDDPMASPPGEPFEEPSASDWEVFRTRTPAAFGPVTDEYGTFISGLAPVLDPRSGEVLLVVGVDLPAEQWLARIAAGRWHALLVAIIPAAILVAGVTLLRWRDLRGTVPEGWWSRNIEAMLTGVMCLIITAIAAIAANDIEQRTNTDDFSRLAEARSQIVKDAFHDVTREIATLSKYFEQSEFISADEFHGFAASAAASHGIHSLTWVPVVPAVERGRFEAQMNCHGMERFFIFAQDEAGQRIAAAPGDVHFPVVYVAPVEGNERMPGFDLGSDPACRSAIERSVQSGLPVSTEPLHLFQETAGGRTVLLLHPVRKTDQDPLAGFAVGALRPQTMLVRAMDCVGQADPYAQISLIDLSGKASVSLAEYPPRDMPDRLVSGTGSNTGVATFPLFIFGSSWAVEVRPGAAFNATHGTRAGPAVVIGGLALSLAAAICVGIQRNRRAGLQDLVRERTRKLEESEQTLRASETKMHAIVQSIQTGLLLIDAQTQTVVEVNPAAERMIGATRDQILGQVCHAFVCAEECADPRQSIDNTERALQTSSGEKRAIIKNATQVDLNGRPHVLESFVDITDRKRMEEELRTAARTDLLTGLANRAVLMDRLSQASRRADTLPDSRFAVLFFDVDRFKIINDSLGHKAGDALLVEIAGRLRQTLLDIKRTAGHLNDALAARLGGDEFVVVLEGIREASDATAAAEMILAQLARPYRLLNREICSSASMGIVISDMAARRAGDILRDADTAMYEAKSAGRGRHMLFDATMRQRAHDRLALESDLRQAMDRNELFMVYQPIVSLESGELESFEALIRWNHPQRGLVAPSDFIPIAEECGLIVAIGDWVLREACAQQARWQAARAGATPPRISVNLSRVQLMLPDLPERISEILESTGTNPAQLHLEITESAIMRDQQLAIRTLRKLRELGLKLDLDDFGTGYSSLASLHLFPLDVLKIDRSFVANIGRGRDFAALVHAVSQLARNMGIAVVAEGIETPDQLQMLQALDCQFGQGYLFAKPLPADRAINFSIDLAALTRVAA